MEASVGAPAPAAPSRTRVRFVSQEPPGTLIVDVRGGHLYHLHEDGTATRYAITIGRNALALSGVEFVSRKEEWPDWEPTEALRASWPELPELVPGGPGNPMGPRALVLGASPHRIHGGPAAAARADDPGDQGASDAPVVPMHGIRMHNDDVIDLFEAVPLGTEVIVLGPGSDRSGLTSALQPL